MADNPEFDGILKKDYRLLAEGHILAIAIGHTRPADQHLGCEISVGDLLGLDLGADLRDAGLAQPTKLPVEGLPLHTATVDGDIKCDRPRVGVRLLKYESQGQVKARLNSSLPELVGTAINGMFSICTPS